MAFPVKNPRFSEMRRKDRVLFLNLQGFFTKSISSLTFFTNSPNFANEEGAYDPGILKDDD